MREPDTAEVAKAGVERAWDRLLEISDKATEVGPLLLIAIVVTLLMWQLGRLVTKMDWPFGWAGNRFAQDTAKQMTRIAFVVAGLLIGLEILDATALVGAVLGTAGVLGIAVGFAFRDLIENHLAGILLSVRHPFLPNDLVEIDGHEGRIIRLTSRSTILMTLEGNHVRIPNATVFKSTIINYTRNTSRRFEFSVGVGTNEDLAAAQQLGVGIIDGLDAVMDDPKASCLVGELGDSSVALRFFGWVDQTQYDFFKTRSEAIRRVKSAFDDAEIEMPEPIYRVVVKRGQSDEPRAKESDVELDVTVDTHIEEQVERERHEEPDLLEDSHRLE